MASTEETILSSAYTLFSEQGFSGTTIKKVAEAAGISTALVFHHFKNKEGLWRSVEQFALGNLAKNTTIRHEGLEHFLEDIVEIRLALYEDTQRRRFLHWRALEKPVKQQPHLETPKSADQDFQGSGEKFPLQPFYIIEALNFLQKKGFIRQDLDAHALAILIFSTSSYAVWDYADYYQLSKETIQAYKQLLKRQLHTLLVAY